MTETRTGWDLRLLGFWQLRLGGRTVSVGARQQRLIAALALLGARPRHLLAGVLWPESSEDQAAASLRAILFRISHDLPQLLADSRDPVALNAEVRTDLARVRRLIEEIAHPGTDPVHDVSEILRNAELLPGWYDDWVIFEQERLQQQRMAALETLAMRYLAQGDPVGALEAARASAAIEPLRESAQLIIVRSHLAADDRASAMRVFRDFRARLADELGVAPSPRFDVILDSAASPEATRRTPLGAGVQTPLRFQPGKHHP
ncbi:MAG TPA: BTAD domain-containing putative transcriptional regulator [Microbacteriaceae bacterium]|jgi:DNA-binding transcriptional activator of the SARP family